MQINPNNVAAAVIRMEKPTKLIKVDETHRIVETENWKFMKGDQVNFNFNKNTGFMQRWGKTLEEDPKFAPCPEILDIEITTICNGPANRLCPFCYKSNNANGHNMTLAQFQNIIDKMPFLTQCALGADAQGTTNPDMFPMMEYARSKGIMPNLTIADVTPEIATKLAAVAGAVAVSVYRHAGFDVAYDSVKNLTDAGMKQVNLHYMISGRTIEDAYKVINSMKTDERLANVNAIVFLGLKQKGRGVKHDYVTQEQYRDLVQHCIDNDVPFGFDSCSAASFLDSVKDTDNYAKFKELSEDCESTLFSSYINEKGEFFPCSFTENWVEGGWEHGKGINVLEADNFITDVWNHPRVVEFRNALIANVDENGCRNCPAYTVCHKSGYVLELTEDGYKKVETVGDIQVVELATA